MSMGYYGLAALVDFNINEGVAIYKFDCFNLNCLSDTERDNSYNLDGLFTIGFDVNVRRFVSNKGIVKEEVCCRSTLKVDKYSTKCLDSGFKQGVYKFSTKFNKYVEENNKIPDKISFII